jgi:hypothetical protein
VIPTPFAKISGDGGVVNDRTQAFWTWLVDSDPFTYTLKLSMEQINVDGVNYARSKFILLQDPLETEVADAWLYQDFPQYSIDLNGKNWGLTNVVGPSAPYFQPTLLRPANYAETGGLFPGPP